MVPELRVLDVRLTAETGPLEIESGCRVGHEWIGDRSLEAGDDQIADLGRPRRRVFRPCEVHEEPTVGGVVRIQRHTEQTSFRPAADGGRQIEEGRRLNDAIDQHSDPPVLFDNEVAIGCGRVADKCRRKAEARGKRLGDEVLCGGSGRNRRTCQREEDRAERPYRGPTMRHAVSDTCAGER